MSDVIVHQNPVVPLAPGIVEVDELAARRSLREQIAKLERDLSTDLLSAFPREGLVVSVPALGGPRILGLGDLEELRDELAERADWLRRELGRRHESEAESRALLERMLLEPERFKWVRVSNEDIGEPGCRHWHVRPKWGPLGLLLSWWRVKISSGCPIAMGHGAMP